MRILLGILGFVIALAVLFEVALFAGWLRAPAGNFLAHKLQRPVAMVAFRGNLISTAPWIEAHELRIGNTAQTPADAAPLADIQNVKVAFRWSQLLQGKIDIAALTMAQGNLNLVRHADGTANWSRGKDTSAQLPIPPIHRFYLAQSRIRIQDAIRKLNFDGTLDSYETESNKAMPFKLEGKGTLNGEAFNLNLTGGALLGTKTSDPYPFNFQLTHGATRITAQGHFGGMFDFSTYTASTTFKGNNLADLYYLTGLAFPITRPYEVSGQFSHSADTYAFKKFTGRVGGSDLSGNISVDTGGKRPYLTADLSSKLLDPADAGVIFGTPDPNRVLPDVPLDTQRLRAMDADVTYVADAINVNTLPLRKVSLKLKLKSAQLDIAPLSLTLPQGTFTGNMSIDAKAATPDVTLDLKLSGARLEDFMAKTSQKSALSGPLVGRVKLHGSGISVHKAAGNADGHVALAVPGGQIQQTFAELLGINVSRALGLMLTDNKQPTALRCAVASFEADKGTLQARRVVLDTGVVAAYGSGTVNLRDESLNLRLKGESKEPRLIRLMAPITVTGNLRHPQLGVQTSAATTQAGVAAVLGAALTPLAAVLPFIDTGLAQNADCSALLERAESHGVPIKSAAPPRQVR